MLFDFESGSEITSQEDFFQLYETAWSDDDDADKLLVAYRALIAAEQGSRTDYLRERIRLETFEWGTACDGEPAFFRLDSGEGVGWSWVLEAHLSIEALALAHEVEESSWGVICPDSPAEERMQLSIYKFRGGMECGEVLGSGTYGHAFMAMMCYRIRQVIATGSQDQPLISRLIASVPEIRQAYAADFAAREAQVIGQVVASGKKGPRKNRDGRSDHRL